MGRPSIGKTAMTSTERSRRRRAGLATKLATKPAEPATKPNATKLDAVATKLNAVVSAAKDAEIAQLKARVRELEVRLRAVAGSRHAESRGVVVDTKLKKLIRRLDSPENDNEAAAALRKLASELQARERGFEKLADLTTQWDQEDAVVRPPKPKPVDWPEIESAVKTCTEEKTKVTMSAVLKAVYASVPKECQEELRQHSDRFIHGCLHRLGFRRRGGMTYERSASP
jgi:hypothetical protein